MELPPTLLLSPDVRKALAEWDWRTVLRAIARETRASQTAIAATAGLSQPQVSRLMNGQSREPSIRTVRALCDGLGIPRALAGLAPAPAEDVDTDVTDRRSFIAGSVGAAVLGAGVRVLDRRTAHVGHAEVNELQDAVRALRTLDKVHGGDSLCDVAVRCLRRADEWLNFATYTSGVEQELQAALGTLAQVTGWLHYDAGRQAAARHYYREALFAAQLARDAELEVLVCSTMSMQAAHIGRPREAVQLAERARERAARWATPRVQALLLLREATGRALSADSAACRRALIEAENVFDPRPHDDDPHWIGFFDTAELTGLKAATFSYLEKRGQTVQLLTRAIRLQAGQDLRRNHAWFQARLAEEHLRQGDIIGACEIFERSLDAFSGIASARVRGQVGRVCTSLSSIKSSRAAEVVDQARQLGWH